MSFEAEPDLSGGTNPRKKVSSGKGVLRLVLMTGDGFVEALQLSRHTKNAKFAELVTALQAPPSEKDLAHFLGQVCGIGLGKIAAVDLFDPFRNIANVN